MDNLDDKTRLMPSHRRGAPSKIGPIRITYSDGGETHSRVFSETFIIGRSLDCGLVITDDGVSRQHAKVLLTDEGWVIRDLGSSNGTFVGGRQVDEMRLTNKASFHLGNEDALCRCGNLVCLIIDVFYGAYALFRFVNLGSIA